MVFFLELTIFLFEDSYSLIQFVSESDLIISGFF